MTFKISVLIGVDGLDDYSAAHGPDEVQVRGVDHHAVLVSRVEAYGGADAQVSRWRHNLLRRLHHLFTILKIIKLMT